MDNCRGGARPRPERRPTRLRGYDYAQPGAYFVTICVAHRKCILGEVTEAAVLLTDLGETVRAVWQALPRRFSDLVLDEFIVMPNHIHAIIELCEGSAALPEIIGTFKSLSTKAVNRLTRSAGRPLWQRSYHDHVIRDDAGLSRLREYIAHNPVKWHLDEENPNRVRQRAGQSPAPTISSFSLEEL